MKKLISCLNFLMLLVLCVVFNSCKTTKIAVIYDGLNDTITIKQFANTSFLNVESNKIYFSYEQNTKVISCPSNKKIAVVSSDPSWCNASVDKDRSNTVIIIKITKNSGQDRTANIAVSVGIAEPVQIEVKQYSTPVQIEGIPILAWGGVQEQTVERYRELKEAGIDHNFTFYPNADVVATALDAARTAGVKIMIFCPELLREPEKVVNRFKEHPALAGYHLNDEPNSKDFPFLSELTRRIQAVDNEHFCYVNLFPDGASTEQLGTSTYLEYVQLFLKEVPVPLLSFDIYPIVVNALGVRSLLSVWYEVLEVISDEARKAGIPFWAFALTTAHWRYPIPTIEGLRLQVFSNLAYGAQTIQYFTYWTPSTNEGFDFHDGPIDYNTKQKTATWYTVQQMSREIKALSNVFLGAQVIKVEHITTNASGGDGNVPIGTKRFNFANRPAEAQIITRFAPANGTNAVVSFLKNDNRCYMVVINRNLDGGGNMSITVEGGAGLQLIKKDGTAVLASSESSNQTVTPGDALIYGWDY